MILMSLTPAGLQCYCLSVPSDPTGTSGDQRTFLSQSLPQLPKPLTLNKEHYHNSYSLKSCSCYFHFFHHIFSSSTIFFTEKVSESFKIEKYKSTLTYMQHSSIQFSSIIQYSRSFLENKILF